MPTSEPPISMRAPSGRHAVVVHPRDNVATLVDELLDATTLADGTPIVGGVPYGHKVARRFIEAGDVVVKYGVVIGTATVPIEVGEHVHVHNVDERTQHVTRGNHGLVA